MSRRQPGGSSVTRVTWLAPELYPDTLDDGEYRIVDEDGNITDTLAVWVDDAPEDGSDGSGHFEAYTGEPEDYFYNTRRRAAADAARGDA